MKRLFIIIFALVFFLGFSAQFTFATDWPLFQPCPTGTVNNGAGSKDGFQDCAPKITAAPTSASTTPVVGTIDKTKVPAISLNDLIKNGVYIAVALTGVIFFFMLIFGGIKYLTSGGDEKAAASARSTLTSAFIGLIIVVAAFLIAQLLFTLFGLQGISVTK